MKESTQKILTGVFLLACVVLLIGCAVIYIWQTGVDWHDTGTVTSWQHLSYYSDDYQNYRTYDIANVTTLQHGIITVDSRVSCYFLTPCAGSDVQVWRVGLKLGIEHHHEGYITENYL